MSIQRFSDRYGVGPKRQQLGRDELPVWVRGEFEFIFNAHSGDAARKGLYIELRPLMWKLSGQRPGDLSDSSLWGFWGRPNVQFVLERCDWPEFFGICETAYELVRKQSQQTAKGFEIAVNKMFATDLMAWKFEDGIIVSARPAEIQEIFTEVSGLLAGPRFAGPNEQFRKANAHLSEKPIPDTENCVKDAVGALEGVARIVTGEPKETLGALLSKGILKSSLPLHLHGVIERLWVYRSDEPGVGHAKIDLSTVGLEEAEWVHAMCATSIVYLVKKFP
jgi:hypothetical protein